jgi:secreted trypsin-like serine protease
MSKLTAAIFGVTAAIPAANASTGSEVVGGSSVPPGKWPDAIAVLGTTGTCSGTLIAPDVVLTAGHCAAIDPFAVVANTTDYTTGTRVPVAEITTYPDWQTSYDVAVIELAQPIPDVAPRQLAAACSFNGFRAGSDVQLVGFGQTGTAANTRLYEATAPVIDPDCTNGHGCREPGGEFVAGDATTSSCFGDSGGPVYLDTPRGTIAIGTVSRGVSGLARPCTGGAIYVRTDKVWSWLRDTVSAGMKQDECVVYSSDPDFPSPDRPTYGGGCSAGGSGVGLGALGALGTVVVRRRPTGIRPRCPSIGRAGF